MSQYSREQIIAYCLNACEELEKSSNFAQTYVTLKRDFFVKFQSPYVFSTVFGADFFKEIMFRVTHQVPLIAENGKALGHYDKNFNIWLKSTT